MNIGVNRNKGIMVIRVTDSLVNFALLMLMLLLTAFGSYALWDSNIVTQSAKPEQFAIYKPTEEVKSFAELQALNPDTIGWLTVYGTPIDYPLMIGEDNFEYLSKNPVGEYSLSGSLFMDFRNDPSFNDFNTIIHGHNMVPEVMFGDIKSFKEQSYFDARKYGNLFYGGKNYGIELLCLLEADAYDNKIYNVAVSGENQQQEYLNNLLAQSTYKRNIEVTPSDRLIMLSTCSTEATNTRDILVGRITDNTYFNEFYTGTENQEKKVWTFNNFSLFSIFKNVSVWGLLLFLVSLLSILLAVNYMLKHKGYRKAEKKQETNKDVL